MEYVEGGELFDYLVKRGKLHADEALHYFQQIISGVDYCHRFNICHRDLKPENLLFRSKDEDADVMVADFGLSKMIDEQTFSALTTTCGTPGELELSSPSRSDHRCCLLQVTWYF